MSAVLHGVAKRHEVVVTSVALAYALQKVSFLIVFNSRRRPEMSTDLLQTPYMFPLIGGYKLHHLKANVQALGLQLTTQDVEEIDKAYDFDLGFPHNFISMAGFAPEGPQHVEILKHLGHFDYVAGPTAIKPHQGQLDAPWTA